MINYLRHLFLPHHTNNHRAKIIHHKVIAVFTIGLLVLLYAIVPLQKQFPSVLGVSSNITVEELLTLTNQKRTEAGVAPLELDQALSSAASAKADYMFEKNFWAHVAPDGTTPWYFIRSAGYEYQYAGENLARGFNSASDVVNAWMDSPTHRANLLSPNYEDIGFAVGSGSLTGADTILVVQAFGSRYGDQAPQGEIASSADELPAGQAQNPTVVAVDVVSEDASEIEVETATQFNTVAAAVNNPLIDTKSTTFNLSVFLLGLFIMVMVIDIIIIERKKISQVVSHNLDHVIYLMVLLAAIVIISGGVII